MIYIIDYENTSNRFLTIENLRYKQGDKVYICWENTKSSHLDGGLILDWQAKGVSFEKLIVYGGRTSATDMQFSSWVGWLFSEDPQVEIIVVSDDRALKGLEDFWKDRKRKLSVINLKESSATSTQPKKVVKFTPEKRQEIHHQLQIDTAIVNEHIPQLMKIIKKVGDKTELQEFCQKAFPGNKGKTYYQKIATIAGI